MFTIVEINEIHERLGSAETLAEYLQALHAIGVLKADPYITDGHSEYRGKNGHTVKTPPAHEVLLIAETGNREDLLDHLNRHGQGQTSYVEMSKGLASCGIERWTFNTRAMTIGYYDSVGHEILVETIR